MKTNLSSPKTFFVIGMPRGGTTIVARLFNSLQDGFCLGEPHWYWQTAGQHDMQKVSDGCFGKMADAAISSDADMRNLLDWIDYRLTWGDYKLGGYKETWFPENVMLPDLIYEHSQRVDFYIVIFRHPAKVHSSQKALGWKEARNVELLLEGYRALDDLARKPKAVPICYELFVQDPLGYLSGRVPFEIQGPLALTPTGHAYGDPYANRCETIEGKDREICLSEEVLAQHEEANGIWQYWSKS